jgi:DNA mismatch endonuclease (patch repair protein)
MPGPVTVATHLRMSRVRREGTEPELLVRHALKALGWPFSAHVKALPGCPDIVLDDQGIVVRVHGCFWHGHSCKRGRLPATNADFWTAKIERNRARDRKTRRQLRALGWKVVTLWECQLREWSVDILSTRLKVLKK